jgi:hypothetical protein
MYAQSQADTAVDDDGLANARLLTLPAISGLAGVGGVLHGAAMPEWRAQDATPAGLYVFSLTGQTAKGLLRSPPHYRVHVADRSPIRRRELWGLSTPRGIARRWDA